MHFPLIPQSKIFAPKEKTTLEQDALLKAIQLHQLTKKEENTLRECRDFYVKAYKFLKRINLSKISDGEARQIKIFLDQIWHFVAYIQNDIYFDYVYRVTTVKNDFLEDGKVRNISFVKNPPLELIKQFGVYGRANTSDSTVFYCSFHPDIALMEIKPPVGQRIIISQWQNTSGKPFVSYPIADKKVLINEGVIMARQAAEKALENIHPYAARIMDSYYNFLGSEFVKDIAVTSQKKYEYLFSAYLSDVILSKKYEKTGIKNSSDCIIYPSIAMKHRTDNLAVRDSSVQKLKPIFMEDCVVRETYYDNFSFDSPNGVILRQVHRSSEILDGDRIIWSDD